MLTWIIVMMLACGPATAPASQPIAEAEQETKPPPGTLRDLKAALEKSPRDIRPTSPDKWTDLNTQRFNRWLADEVFGLRVRVRWPIEIHSADKRTGQIRASGHPPEFRFVGLPVSCDKVEIRFRASQRRPLEDLGPKETIAFEATIESIAMRLQRQEVRDRVTGRGKDTAVTYKTVYTMHLELTLDDAVLLRN